MYVHVIQKYNVNFGKAKPQTIQINSNPTPSACLVTFQFINFSGIAMAPVPHRQIWYHFFSATSKNRMVIWHSSSICPGQLGGPSLEPCQSRITRKRICIGTATPSCLAHRIWFKTARGCVRYTLYPLMTTRSEHGSSSNMFKLVESVKPYQKEYTTVYHMD